MSNLNRPIDYINTHGTSTPIGDTQELLALREVFKEGNYVPAFNSTKSLTGHSQGATGVQESIYSLLMMEHSFISASANVEEPDKDLLDMPLVCERIDDIKLSCVMSNSFGFGGTNASLAFTSFIE